MAYSSQAPAAVACVALLAIACGSAAEAPCAGGAANGTACDGDRICRDGGCVARCIAGTACTAPSPCKVGATSCSAAWAEPACIDAGDVPDATACGFGKVCSAGACVASTAEDILFVIDDSGTMQPKQQQLAASFASFIAALAQMQSARRLAGLEPFDVHVAITSSSVFDGESTPASCQPGAGGALRCDITAPLFGWTAPYAYACTTAGAPCPELIDRFMPTPGCSAGVGAPYPAGDLVAAPGFARVLHFTRGLAWNTWGTGLVDPALSTLVSAFQANVNVGTCGSGMEQHLEAGRLAVEKALARGQAGVGDAEWPHAGAKLVIVWVGDEDDCSSPKDPGRALFFTPGANAPGSDACTADEALPPSLRRAFPVDGYADYFTSLDRPFAAAFVYSATGCRTDASGASVCDPGLCSSASNPDPVFGGLAPGNRFHELASALRARGAQVEEASVCDDFSATIERIATRLVTP